MRIAFAGPADLDLTVPQFAIGVITHELARRLALTHDVIVYGGEDDGPRCVDVDNLAYRSIIHTSPWYLKGLSLFDRASSDSRLMGYVFQSSLYYPRFAFRLARLARRDRVDLLHLHNFFQAIPVIRAVNPNMKIVLHMHAEWLAKVNLRFGRSRLRGADLILGCSDYVTRQIRAAYPELADRVETLYNGCDASCFVPVDELAATKRERCPRIVFVGRISPEKGLHVAIAAMRAVAARFPSARLEIIGPDAPQARHHLIALRNPLVDPRDALQPFYTGRYSDRLRQQAAYQVPGHVEFTIGFLLHEEMRRRYAGADLLVNPSLSETFGMSLIEAMALGLPVVATEVGGMPEIVRDGVTGLLVPPNDSHALANAMIMVLNDAERAEQMGAAGRASVLERFTWEHIVERYQQLLARLAAPEREPGTPAGRGAIVNGLRDLAKRTLPPSTIATLRILRAHLGSPFDLRRRRRPLGGYYERGLPIDRYYIENFLERHRSDIRGQVLEVGDPAYTLFFGAERVTRSEILHVESGNPQATIVGNLETGENIPAEAFDCFIATQLYPFLYDVRAAIANSRATLAPGGVLLATLPSISQISRYDMEHFGDFWRFTDESARRLFGEVFGSENVQVEIFGNVLSACAFLYGLGADELTHAELDDVDPDYPVAVTVRAVKPPLGHVRGESMS
jgi:glycosyltransferase involved in cell wall biosynthesis